MPGPFVPTVSLDDLGDADGADLVLVFVDGSQIPTADMATVDDITAEITGAAVSRVAATGVVTTVTGRKAVAWVEDLFETDAPDLDGAAEVTGWWVALGTLDVTPDSGMRLLAWNPILPTPGTSPFPVRTRDGNVFAWAGPPTEGTGEAAPAITVHNELEGREAPGSHPIEAVTGLRAELDALTGDTGASGRTVALFATDFDAAGGSFTTVPVVGVGDLPRANLEDQDVLIITGDDVAVWNVTASGPCTAGEALVPGEVITSTFIQGLVGVPYTWSDGMVFETRVMVQARSDDLTAAASELSGDVTALGERLVPLELNADEAPLMDALVAQAKIDDPPVRYAVCGDGDTLAYWKCPTLPAIPTDLVVIEAWSRSVSGDGTGSNWQEEYSYALDSGGVSGAGGDNDGIEKAKWDDHGRIRGFGEWTSFGEPLEWHRVRNLPAPTAASEPGNTWVRSRLVLDLTAGIVYIRYRADLGWDWEDPDDGSWWRTACTYDTGAPITLAAYNDTVEQWIGRGGGRFHVARVRRWDDGVEVLDFDPSTGAASDTTVTDSVLLDVFDSPAVWSGVNAAAVLEDAPPAGAVESVNGQTGTVVLDAADVGAATPSDVATAVSGLVHTSRALAGLDLSADRSASDLRTALALVVGTNVQAFHANLAAIAGLTLVADRLPYADGTGTLALTTFTAAARALLDDADAAAMLATLGASPSGISRQKFASGSYTPLLHGAPTTVTMVNERMYYGGGDLDLTAPQTFDRFAVYHETGTATTGTIRLAIYYPSAIAGIPGARYLDLGNTSVDATSGAGSFKYVSGSWLLPAGRWIVAPVVQGLTGTAPVFTAVSNTFPTAYPTATNPPNQQPIQASVSGSAPNPAAPSGTSNTMPVIYARAA